MRGSFRALVTFCAYLIIGVLVGALATVAHRSRVVIADVPIWWGLIAAFLLVLCFGVGLRLYLEDRMPTLAVAIGVVVAVFALSLSGAEHSVLIPASASGIGAGEIWTYGSAIAAFVPVIWPRLRAARAVARSRSQHGPR